MSRNTGNSDQGEELTRRMDGADGEGGSESSELEASGGEVEDDDLEADDDDEEEDGDDEEGDGNK